MRCYLCAYLLAYCFEYICRLCWHSIAYRAPFRQRPAIVENRDVQRTYVLHKHIDAKYLHLILMNNTQSITVSSEYSATANHVICHFRLSHGSERFSFSHDCAHDSREIRTSRSYPCFTSFICRLLSFCRLFDRQDHRRRVTTIMSAWFKWKMWTLFRRQIVHNECLASCHRLDIVAYVIWINKRFAF